MNLSNTFKNLKVRKIAQDTTLAIYPEDAKSIQDYIAFKQNALGGELVLADVFQCLVRYLWLDADFARAHPNAEAEVQAKPRRYRPKRAR